MGAGVRLIPAQSPLQPLLHSRDQMILQHAAGNEEALLYYCLSRRPAQTGTISSSSLTENAGRMLCIHGAVSAVQQVADMMQHRPYPCVGMQHLQTVCTAVF